MRLLTAISFSALVTGSLAYAGVESLPASKPQPPRAVQPLPAGERYTIADLHPMPLFGLCTGGR